MCVSLVDCHIITIFILLQKINPRIVLRTNPSSQAYHINNTCTHTKKEIPKYEVLVHPVVYFGLESLLPLSFVRSFVLSYTTRDYQIYSYHSTSLRVNFERVNLSLVWIHPLEVNMLLGLMYDKVCEMVGEGMCVREREGG